MIIQLIASYRTIFYASSIIFFMFLIIKSCYGAKNEQFTNCSRVFSCGHIQDIGYPFWGGDRPSYCGRQVFGLDCFQEEQSTNIFIGGLYYIVLRIDQSIPRMTIVQRSLWNNSCRAWRHTSSLPNFSITKRLVRTIDIFYGCTSEVVSKVQIPSNVTCEWKNGESGVFFADSFVPDVKECNLRLSVPISVTAYFDLWDRKITLGRAIDQGFDVQYNPELTACSACEASGGRCGSNSNDQFICICPDRSYPWFCPPNHGKNGWLKAVIGATAVGIVISACLIVGYCRYKGSLDELSLPLFKRKTLDDQNLEAIIKQYGSLAPRRYSYSDIKKMTNSFRDKLGQGGYGDVYKGYLSESIPVAVKIIKTTKGNGEEFINEVASISRTSHVNVVTLLGFCIGSRKRALIYEFLSNGSLDKFIHKESGTQLGLNRLYEIATGIARGLEYLHRGCNTRILHFDIKPHNILLDEDFCPKISDFGLAKLCSKKESIVSMLGARGTIGYIAPEVFSRNFGGVSYKSDVYSYGMMLLEMVGGRRNAINIGMSNTSETYFPDWIYQRIISDEDLKLQDHAMSEEENQIARKMILVGLWCIQTDPSHRPTMSKVIDMLESTLKDLELPPKPFLCSPSRSDGVSLAATTVVSSKGTLSSPPSLADSCTTSTGNHFLSPILTFWNSKKSSKRSRD